MTNGVSGQSRFGVYNELSYNNVPRAPVQSRVKAAVKPNTET